MDSIKNEGAIARDGRAAGTEFYRENQVAMDEGVNVAWKERFNHDELSAIQHAMNLSFKTKLRSSRNIRTNRCPRNALTPTNSMPIKSRRRSTTCRDAP